ncbi:MAG TPA: GIY-YIG nuclease family protein [Acetobacteraceae bacterium]|jgi:putative endonuclease
MEPRFFVYMMTNDRQTALYAGVTSNLVQRVQQHRTHVIPGFSARYNLDKLVFYEEVPDVAAAIAREKQIKGGSRRKKVMLIDAANPDWRNLYGDLL